MTASKTFSGVSPGVWEKMKAFGREQHGTVFDPEDGTHGRATTPSPLGAIVLAYAFDPDVETITYTIERKPMFVGDFLIWHGIDATLGRCRHD